MSSTNYLQKLSDEQYNAIVKEGNVLLTAIPGSGKTRTLTNKVLYEFDELEYRKIIAITYTNRAAEEMEERIIGQLGYVPGNIWIGTIHKFCLEFILRKYSSQSQFLSKPFTILGEEDDDHLKKELKEKYKIDKYANIDYTLSTNGTPNEKLYYDYVDEYYSIQRKTRKINFDLILYEAFKLLQSNKNIALNISAQIKYLCVDEYQDTQELQYQILAIIYKETKGFNIFFVGDPNQAIYAGLGGIVKTKNELELIFEGIFSEMILTKCYRSNQQIIDFYSRFAIKKIEMLSCNGNYKKPTVYINASISKDDLIDEISKIISQNIDEGIPEKEICIIAPQWTFLYNISNKLRIQLPNLKFDAPNIIPLKKDEENICYKLSKILLTNYSFYNKNRVIHIIREVKKQLIEEYGINLELSEQELLKILFASKTDDSVGTSYLKNSLCHFFKKIGMGELFQDKVIDYINESSEKIKLYEKYGIEDDKLAFEKSLRSKDGIVVSTIHGIKGDEFRTVIAFGLLEGYVPHWDSIINKGTAREDSNKLLFVLCSRAKEKLYLFSETDRTTNKGAPYHINEDIKKTIIDLQK